MNFHWKKGLPSFDVPGKEKFRLGEISFLEGSILYESFRFFSLMEDDGKKNAISKLYQPTLFPLCGPSARNPPNFIS